ncbi:hypothetical protein PMIN06_002689 [Paraphaeosphaeria minitans]
MRLRILDVVSWQNLKGRTLAFIFLSMTGYRWAQYLPIASIQFDVPQVELGISGGLAGMSRFAGGAIATSEECVCISATKEGYTLKYVVLQNDDFGTLKMGQVSTRKMFPVYDRTAIEADMSSAGSYTAASQAFANDIAEMFQSFDVAMLTWVKSAR